MTQCDRTVELAQEVLEQDPSLRMTLCNRSNCQGLFLIIEPFLTACRAGLCIHKGYQKYHQVASIRFGSDGHAGWPCKDWNPGNRSAHPPLRTDGFLPETDRVP